MNVFKTLRLSILFAALNTILIANFALAQDVLEEQLPLPPAPTAAEIIQHVRITYNERFDEQGQYINDPNLLKKFIPIQNAAIETLRANGNLRNSFKILNDVMSDLVVTVTSIQDESGAFLGLLIERSKYNSEQEESSLRFFVIESILHGKDILKVKDKSLIKIKSEQLIPEFGGVVSIQYVTNFKNDSSEHIEIDIVKSPNENDFRFYTKAGQGFKEVTAIIWFNIITRNFGVKRLEIR